MRRCLLAIVCLLLAQSVSAQQWDQVNGSMQVRSGPTAPLVIIDQTASGQRIVSFRANGVEVCYATSTAFTCAVGVSLTGGQVLAADGTSGAPSYSFASEATLGFWRSSAANVTLQGRLTTTAGLSIASLAISGTAPTTPVACTSPTVTWSNGTAAFQIDVGTTCAAVTTLVVTLPAVTNAWSCHATNVTTSATAKIEMTASTTTSATFTNYTRTTGVALAFVDGADVRISCVGG